MAKTRPWHAKHSNVHHDNTNCTEGNNVERRNEERGAAGLRKCKHCKKLDK